MSGNDSWWAGTPDLVVSGISARLPESDSVVEFGENLLQGVDMVTEDSRRWEPGFHGLPRRHGKLKEINKLDAAFFGITPKAANYMDPQMRMLLEVVYEAMVDAGVDPRSLRGSRTAVFVGASATESTAAFTRDPDKVVGYSLTGTALAMFANRVSYSFDLRGPSFTVDAACSSGLLALQLAVDSIRRGECDRAIVAGTHVTLFPTTSMQFMKMSMTSPHGKSRSFDKDADGYVRGEGVVAVLVQRAPEARRCYATVLHAKSSTDGYKQSGITVPSGDAQAALLTEVYKEISVDPGVIEYVEAHGTGTKVGDPLEANALASVFCTSTRQDPLLIGSVKSNMGHAEPVSGLASLCKVIVAMHGGTIPGNLHFVEPNPNIPALVDGRIRVVAEPTAYKGGLVGINSFGFGGSNTHICLRPPGALHAALPPQIDAATPEWLFKLVTYSGRTKEGVTKGLQLALENSTSPGLHAMLNALAHQPVGQCHFRGYAILYNGGAGHDVQRAEVPQHVIDVQSAGAAGQKRPVWFVYSGMGSQWPQMGSELMRHVPHFRDSVQRCHECLTEVGFDLLGTLSSSNPDTFSDNTLNCIVCITAVQLALTDLLRELQLTPDYIIGHSTGEMACAYADGCLSRKQVMLLAYYRGKLIVDNGLNSSGGMAAVGLTWEAVQQRLEGTGISAACHNASDNVTVSGDREQVAALVQQCETEGIFARAVNSTGVPFHSPAMQPIKQQLTEHFTQIIGDNAEKRSTRWISTSNLSLNGDLDSSEPSSERPDKVDVCDAAYHVNNVLSPVMFYPALQKHLPKNAILLEVAPHSILRAVLRRTAAPLDGITASLMQARHDTDSQTPLAEVTHLLKALGQLHQSGSEPQVDALWKAGDAAHSCWPVAPSTPMLAHTVRWQHEQDWMVADLKMMGASNGSVSCCVSMSLDPLSVDSSDQGGDNPHAYIMDHVIDGRVLLPFCVYLHVVWQAVAKLRRVDYEQMQIVFTEVTVHRPTIVNKKISLDVVYTQDGFFEVYEGGEVSCSGYANVPQDNKPFYYQKLSERFANDDSELCVSNEDLYKEIQLRGYEYKYKFRGIHSSTLTGHQGMLRWHGHWPAFFDCLLQTALLPEKDDNMRLPVRLNYLRVDPQTHLKAVGASEDSPALVPFYNDVMCGGAGANGALSGGVEYRHLKHQSTSIRLHAMNHNNIFTEVVHWVPYVDWQCLGSATYGAVGDEELQQFRDYSAACNQTFRSLLNKVGMSTANGVKKRPEVMSDSSPPASEDVQGPLLRVLHELHKCADESPAALQENGKTPSHGDVLSDLLKLHYEELLEDDLWQCCMMQRPLKQIVDTISENCAGHNIKLAIVNPDAKLSVVKAVSGLLLTHPRCTLQWLAVFQNEADLQGCDQSRAEQLNCRLGSLDTILADDSDKEYDAVFVHDAHLHEDVTGHLSQSCNLIRADGFVVATSGNERSPLLDLLHFVETAVHGDGLNVDALLHFTKNTCPTLESNLRLKLVATQTDDTFPLALHLLHRSPDTPYGNVFINIDDVDELSWMQPLKEESALPAAQHLDRRVWIIAHKAPFNGTNGLGLCLRDEYRTTNRYRKIDLDFFDRQHREQIDLSAESELVQQCVQRDLHANVLTHLFSKSSTQFAVACTPVRGDLNSLTWVQSWHDAIKDETNLAAVHYASINFRDIMIATGSLPPEANLISEGGLVDRDCLFGTEFSGVAHGGRRVMGIMHCLAMATTVDLQLGTIFDVPSSWSLREAATVPVVYMTAYYALVVRGRLQPGETVLIHSGSGGVGLASISIALSLGCRVFTSVGSSEKRQFVQRMFPQLTDDKCFVNSRSTEFEYDILDRTEGRGVDVLLNSLAGDMLQASIRCLAANGRFVEIGKFDIFINSKLGMEIFRKNITVCPVIMDHVLDSYKRKMAANEPFGLGERDIERTLQLFEEGIKNGVVKPLPTTIFAADKLTDAFRYMAGGKHMGKVLIEMAHDDANESPNGMPAQLQSVSAQSRTVCHPNHVYLLTGGLGGFGLEMANWLIKRGARRLVLTSRSGVKNGYQRRYLHYWRQRGVHVLVSKLDVCQLDECEQLLALCQEQGAVAGVFHLALVLLDALFEDQTEERFGAMLKTKLTAVHNLDEVTRRVCGDELKWFVAFSSITAGRGNMGQTNYAYANSAMERVLQKRALDKLPALNIQWGAVGDVGVFIDNLGTNDTVVAGTLPMRMLACLAKLDAFLTWPSHAHTVSTFLRADTNKAKVGGAGSGDVGDTIASIIGLSSGSELDGNASLQDLGLDSLMGVEVKQALEAKHNIVLSIKDIRGLTVNKLRQQAAAGGTAPKSQSDSLEDTKSDFDSEISTDTESSDAAAKRQAERMRNVFNIRISPSAAGTFELPVVECNTQYDTPVWLLHPIEGLMDPLKQLVAALPYRCMCVQAVPGVDQTSVQAMAAHYEQLIVSRQREGPYYIIGYSYGACVAFELAALLQSSCAQPRHNVTLLVDGSPDYNHKFIGLYRAFYGVGAGSLLVESPSFQVDYLCAYVARVNESAANDSLQLELGQLGSWEDRVKLATARAMQGGWATQLFRHEHLLERFIVDVTQRFSALDTYEPSADVSADLVLIRASESALKDNEFGADYGLSKRTRGQVQLHTVQGDHDSFVSGGEATRNAAALIDALLTEAQQRQHAPGSQLNAVNGHASVANGDVTNGHVANGDVTNGHVANGDVTNGHATNGNLTNGELAHCAAAGKVPHKDTATAANGHLPQARVNGH